MKSFKIVFMLLVLSVAAFAQTEDKGLGAFANDKSDIMLAVDAGVAIWDLRSPYVMFVVYMASKKLSRDITLCRHLGKKGIASSWMRFYEFPAAGDFFRPLALCSLIRADEGFMTGFNGFMTKCYFKNPGFKKGDKLVIRVTAKNKPELTGEVVVVL